MDEIVESVRRVTEMIAGITTATESQSAGIGEVNQAVGHLDQMTQQNAALVEQSAAAAESLKESAGRLSQAVAAFRDGGGAPIARAVTVATAAPTQAFDFASAIRAHGEWKQKLRHALLHHETVDAGTLRLDDRCAMGKWLHGDGKLRCGSHPLFGDLLGTHAAFHRAAGQVAECVNREDRDGAERLMAPGSDFANASQRVGEIAMRLRKDVERAGARVAA